METKVNIFIKIFDVFKNALESKAGTAILFLAIGLSIGLSCWHAEHKDSDRKTQIILEEKQRSGRYEQLFWECEQNKLDEVKKYFEQFKDMKDFFDNETKTVEDQIQKLENQIDKQVITLSKIENIKEELYEK